MQRRSDGLERRTSRGGAVRSGLFLLLSALAIQGCGDQDAGWRATRDAVGAREADEGVSQQEWRSYRNEVVVSLDEMRTALERSPGTETVVDEQQAGSLLKRVGLLRNRFVREASMPPEQAAEERPERVAASEAMRRDVDAFVRRLGHDPADMAYWQDVEGPG